MTAALWHYPSIAFFFVEHGGSWDDCGGRTQVLPIHETIYLLLMQILLKTHSSSECSQQFSNRRLLISCHLLVPYLQEGSLPQAIGKLWWFVQHSGSFCIHFSATLSALESARAAWDFHFRRNLKGVQKLECEIGKKRAVYICYLVTISLKANSFSSFCCPL